MAAIRGKLAGKYDSEAEAEVLSWFKSLLNEDLQSGMREVEKQLRNGQLLVKLAKIIQQGTPKPPEKARKMTLKPNTLSAPFKQMENIQVFLNFCENYGVPKNALFQTVDLFEGRNMAQVLACLQLLGSEAQRNSFNGATIGPKPQEKNIREFSDEQLRAGQSIIGLQAGTNKCASQSGMSMGGVRHVADIRADDFDKAGQGDIGLQAGSNKGASQAGMSMGSVRHVSDIRADDMSKDSASVISLQSGSNKGASQSGMSMGGVRHVADIRADDMSRESQSTVGLQAGSNKGASQTGMSMGGVRHAADIRADDASKEGQSIMGMQAGFREGASQAGMSMGGVRHAADIRADDASKEGSAVLGLQMGSNKGASQAGMSMGSVRHVADIRADDLSKEGSAAISLQYGITAGHPGRHEHGRKARHQQVGGATPLPPARWSCAKHSTVLNISKSA
jgi:hypothetical protein